MRMMADQRKRVDITSADSKYIGFEYQYLYFILKLLQLSTNDEVGYEALDDVHTISFREQKTFFYQLKHTTIVTASGEQPNLTVLSEDLWKTLSNWCKLITDASEGRACKVAQKDFLNKSKFVFVINRNFDSNDVILNMVKLQKKQIGGAELVTLLKQLCKKTKDITIKQYIEDVLSIGTRMLTAFVNQTEFVNTPDNLFDLIRDEIRNKMVLEEYVDDVLASLYLQLKEDFFKKIQSGQHQTISYLEWINKYQGVFNQYRTTQLPIRMHSRVLPDHLENQKFVKELIEINAINMDEDGFLQIAELTDQYLRIKLQLEAWYQEGRITYSILEQFNQDAILQWKNIHRAAHRSTNKNADLDFPNALDCFDKLMIEKLTLLSTELGMSMSNGEFIKLADEEKIGWKYCWKDRYY